MNIAIGNEKIAKKVFTQLSQLLVSSIDLEVKTKLLKTYVWSAALYVHEAWSKGIEE